MSYLTYPRLHFSGKFQADPSTVNNNPDNFSADQFQADYTKLTDKDGDAWNPKGTGSWRFQECIVTAVEYSDGTSCKDPKTEPVIGMSIANINSKVAAKIVDLDTQQQMVSEIWGFQLSLIGSDGPVFTGDLQTVAFADAWVRRTGKPVNANFGAFYQSVLLIKQWKPAPKSRYLQELAALYGNKQPNKLSIKFNVDGHNSDATSADFTFGRVVGAIGSSLPGEPAHFVGGRLLVPADKRPGLNTAYGIVAGNTLHIDLGNSIPTTQPGGPLINPGPLTIAAGAKNQPGVTIGIIDYKDETWYSLNSGIVSFRMTSEQQDLVNKSPLTISSGNQGAELIEDESGLFIRTDSFVFRLNPGDEQMAIFYAYAFGTPLKNKIISLAPDVSNMDSTAFELGTPAKALTIPSKITTDLAGMARLSMKAGDPGKPRNYIDGQLYGVGFQLGETAPAPGTTNYPISIIIYSGYSIPETPNWIEHVEPIFSQYAALYPVMKPIVDLSNFSSVVQKNYILKNVFNTPMEDPNYMPVTRDLSEAKRAMIRKWLNDPIYMNLDSAENLQQALQQAIELEHSTIPPYLTALYSIKPGLNSEVASLIRSVVLEEMLHMALVCNILVSIGGSPKIGHPKFVPAYPTSLPGGLRFGLTVRLRKCSIEHIRECFMSIEEPEQLIMVRRNQLRPESHHPSRKYTIGWFYDEIVQALQTLAASGKITFEHLDKQVEEWSGTGQLYKITSIADAIKAIREIQDQGEGTSVNPHDGNDELAHYYKFSEIAEGRHLVKQDDQYSYIGAPIAFDENSVWPMVDDPSASIYQNGSRAQILNSEITEMYRALLGALHTTFNGDPKHLKDAIGLMFSLETIALRLVSIPSGLPDGSTAGPSFQF